ncbi:SCND3 protein, partial [Amia calva]|nr:SCND3 protein [Amia calva]
HLETLHKEHVGKPVSFIKGRKEELSRQQVTFKRALSVPGRAQRASFEVSYTIAQAKKPHISSLKFPAIDSCKEHTCNLLSQSSGSLLLPFATKYLCEAGFSTLVCIKSLYRSTLDVTSEIRCAISTTPPDFDKLCDNIQAHTPQ